MSLHSNHYRGITVIIWSPTRPLHHNGGVTSNYHVTCKAEQRSSAQTSLFNQAASSPLFDSIRRSVELYYPLSTRTLLWRHSNGHSFSISRLITTVIRGSWRALLASVSHTCGHETFVIDLLVAIPVRTLQAATLTRIAMTTATRTLRNAVVDRQQPTQSEWVSGRNGLSDVKCIYRLWHTTTALIRDSRMPAFKWQNAVHQNSLV